MKPQRYIKLCSTLGLLSVSIGIFLSHQQDNVWPSIQISVIAALMVTILFLRLDRSFSPVALLLPIGLGIFLRLYTYTFPASMIGFDPDFYALQIQKIIMTGSAEVVQNSYYTAAPLFHVLAACTGLVSGLPATKAMAIYPTLMGIVFPLVTFLLVRRCLDDQCLGSWVGFAGSLVAAVAAMSVNLSYQPIAETLAAMQWIVFVYATIMYIGDRSWQAGATILLLLTALIFTHKLPPTAAVVMLSTLSLGALALWILQIGRETRKRETSRISVYLTLITSGFVVIQYFYLSTLGQNLALRFFMFIDPQYQSALYSASFPATDAVPIGQGLFQRIIRNLHGLILIPTAAISWVALAIGTTRNHLSMHALLVVLAGAASTSLMMLVTLAGPVIGGGVGRTLLIAEPLLISVVVLVLYRRPQVIRVMVLILVIAQLFSGTTIAPDYRKGAEMYLHKPELGAKEFSTNFVDETIYTDNYYSTKPLPSHINKGRVSPISSNNSQYEGFNDKVFLNGSLAWENNDYILYRNKTKFRTSFGWYQLTWDPLEKLNHRYNKIYSNNDVLLYTNQTR